MSTAFMQLVTARFESAVRAQCEADSAWESFNYLTNLHRWCAVGYW